MKKTINYLATLMAAALLGAPSAWAAVEADPTGLTLEEGATADVLVYANKSASYSIGVSATSKDDARTRTSSDYEDDYLKIEFKDGNHAASSTGTAPADRTKTVTLHMTAKKAIIGHQIYRLFVHDCGYSFAA